LIDRKYEIFLEFTDKVNEIAISNLFKNVIIDYITNMHEDLVSTPKGFCAIDISYALSVGAEEFEKVIRIDIKTETEYTFLSWLNCLFNIPTTGFTPVFGISSKKMSDDIEWIVEMALMYNELFDCKSSAEFFIRLIELGEEDVDF